MTRMVIVPNALRDEIYRAVDAALERAPQFQPEREAIYRDILAYYDEHGVVPDFDLTPARTPEDPDHD